MCVAYPARVLGVEPEGGVAVVDAHGRPQRVALLALAGPVTPGDWLLVHSGIALARLDADDARDRLALIDRGTGDVR
jgi:hydrogenase expression/formation protein HypC